MRAIPIDALRAFIAVVEKQSFTKAAEALGRTQPTVSLQVKRLEELVETPLFARASRLTLTAVGEICLERGRRILAEHDQMIDAVVRQRAAPDALRLGIALELETLLAPRLARLSRETDADAEERFYVTYESSEILLERLESRELDVALTFTREPGAHESLERWSIPMTWVASPSFRTPTSGAIPLIASPDGSVLFRMAIAALRKSGRPFEITCASARLEVLKTAIEAGKGVCALPRSLAPLGARLVPSSQIAALPDVTLALFAPRGIGESARSALAKLIEVIETSCALARS